MSVAMHLLLVAALAVTSLFPLQADARLLLPWSRAQGAFAELRSPAAASSAAEADSSSEGSDSSSGGSEASSDKEEAEAASASNAGSHGEDQEASGVDQSHQTKSTEGSAAEPDESGAASAAESKIAEGAGLEGQQPEQQPTKQDESQKSEEASTEEQQQVESQQGTSVESQQGTSEKSSQGGGEGGISEQPAPSESESRAASEKLPQFSPQATVSEGETQETEAESAAGQQATASAAAPQGSELASTGEQQSSPAEAAPGSASGAAGPGASSAQETRMQKVTPHAPAEPNPGEEKPQESPGAPKVEEITAHCVLTHNKIRTARLDQWPDPLTADDALAEAARKRAKEYIAYNCKLPEGTKPDPLSELVAPKNGNACEGLSYVFLDGLSEIQRTIKEEFPGPFTPADSKSAWHSDNAQKFALIVSETGKSVGCAATVGCPEDVFICNYSPSLIAGKEALSKQFYSALKKRDRVEARGKQFLPGAAADHEVKSTAGAKVAQMESSAAFFSSPLTIEALLVISVSGALLAF